MDVYAVSDAMIFGKGVFGIFSTPEKAVCFKEEFERESKYFCEIKQLTVIGSYKFSGSIFAAYTYDLLYDMHTFDGLYAESEIALDAAGKHGLVEEFVIDLPGKRKI
jgi:hypothetical protein